MRDYRIGRLKGRFVVTWHDAAGKRARHRLAALTVRDAEREALDVIRRETVAPATATVSELWATYRSHLGSRPTGTTMKYTGIAVLDHFGALRPDQIADTHCTAYIAKRRRAGIKAGSIWTELGHLRSCMTWAAKHRLIAAAPWIERPQKPAPKERYLTRAEIDRLLAADAEPHVRLAILLMLTTAGRVGAILDLTWNRVDLERGQIRLRADIEGPRKGRATVPINATLRAALTAAREAALSDYVVEWAGGRVRSIRRGFQRACDNAGLHGVGHHTLRHSAAVHMAEAGVPMEVISQYLGHSSVQTTRAVYARFSADYMAEAAGALEFGGLRAVQATSAHFAGRDETSG